MTKIYYTSLILLLTMVACNSKHENNNVTSLDIQGHRGARGLLPENSIPGFLLAIDHGVTTLELDLAVTADKQIVVSHEPWMNHAICKTPQGDSISEVDEQKFNIYALNYEDVKQFDCGSLGNIRFPEQNPMPTHKPLLTDVFRAVSNYCIEKNIQRKLRYNIEIKSMPEGDSIFHPTPEEFSDLVYKLISESYGWEGVNIQSFDFRVLQYFNSKYPEVELAVLIENETSIEDNLKSLGFTPEIYSCWYKLLKQTDVANLQQLGMKVIPWTVNDVTDMQQLANWGVDGIITDYPDRAKQLK